MKLVKFNKITDCSTRELISPYLVAPLILLTRTCYPDELACDYHQIDNFYIALIVKGEMTYQERNRQALCGRRGDLFILSAGNDYCWNVTEPTVSLQCRHNGFPVSEYGTAGSIFGCRNYPVTMVHLGETVTAAFELEVEQGRKGEFGTLYYSSAILRLLAEATVWISESGNEESQIRTSHTQLAAQCAAYIENRLTKNIDIGKMAHDCRISKRKLFLLFQTHFSMPPLHYIAMRKIEQARKMILKSNLSNDEIATALGFSDTNYFILFFKKHTGASPMQMRRNALKNQRA
jgi:AraC-like DNA-binding protein